MSKLLRAACSPTGGMGTPVVALEVAVEVEVAVAMAVTASSSAEHLIYGL